MCTGAEIAIISAVSTAAGTGLQMKAQSDARNEIQSAQLAADQKNKRLINESQSAQLAAAEMFDPTAIEENQEVEANKIQERLVANLSGGFDNFGGGSERPAIVQQAVNRESQKATDYNTGLAEALANLRGFDQNLFNQNINLNRTAQDTALNNAFIHGNADALSADVAAVDVSSPFGDALTTLGGVGLQAGLSTPTAKTPPIPTKKPAVPSNFSSF